MEAAKNAVTSFLRRDEKHHTDVDESANPTVTSETVKPHHRQPADVDRMTHDGIHDPEETGHSGFQAPSSGNAGPVHEKTEQRHNVGVGAGGAATGTPHHEGEAFNTPAGTDTISGHHKTANAYNTNADEKTTFDRTPDGLTGAGGRHGHQDDTAAPPHSNPAATDSSVTDAAAGSVAADLGRDHRRGDQVGAFDSKNTDTSAVGDAGSKTAGTSLAGRADGNTPTGASTAASQDLNNQTSRTHESQAEQRPTERGKEDEPSNLSGGHAGQPKDVSADDDVQHASKQGQDPSLEKDRGKWTGTGADGSHSAVFGLTPDGHTFNDTSRHPGGSGPPESESESKGENAKRHESAVGGEDIGSRDVASGKVAEQMHDPRVAEKGHEGQAEHTHSDLKPGAGA